MRQGIQIMNLSTYFKRNNYEILENFDFGTFIVF